MALSYDTKISKIMGYSLVVILILNEYPCMALSYDTRISQIMGYPLVMILNTQWVPIYGT